MQLGCVPIAAFIRRHLGLRLESKKVVFQKLNTYFKILLSVNIEGDYKVTSYKCLQLKLQKKSKITEEIHFFLLQLLNFSSKYLKNIFLLQWIRRIKTYLIKQPVIYSLLENYLLLITVFIYCEKNCFYSLI